MTWDAEHGREHVTTYGTTKVACEQAAMGGNRVKQALGWPEEMCRATPARRSTRRRSTPEPYVCAHGYSDFWSCDECVRQDAEMRRG